MEKSFSLPSIAIGTSSQIENHDLNLQIYLGYEHLELKFEAITQDYTQNLSHVFPGCHFTATTTPTSSKKWGIVFHAKLEKHLGKGVEDYIRNFEHTIWTKVMKVKLRKVNGPNICIV